MEALLEQSQLGRLTSQKNRKSKDVFDIAGRVLSETAVREYGAVCVGQDDRRENSNGNCTVNSSTSTGN